MNTKEDQLCMDVLAAIAWADGEVSVNWPQVTSNGLARISGTVAGASIEAELPAP